MKQKIFNPGFDIQPKFSPLGFEYGKDCFGPKVENRKLDTIRPSLLDQNCDGPEIVYSIAMDVGKQIHRNLLNSMHLLYGAVTYAAGRLGEEPIRSQGHIHKTSQYAQGWSTPEVYEIWTGKAVIYMQESANDDPRRCFAVYASPGDVVIVPPGWAHATISADPGMPLSFGAWCNRDYGFEYDLVRKHKGLAWYPLLEGDQLKWKNNSRYTNQQLIEKTPEMYEGLGLSPGIPIYTQFETNPQIFSFVPKPKLKEELWRSYVP
ncbi:MAG: hypothetical protein JXR03_06610 [Cyclobacteriaceae bacterium]